MGKISNYARVLAAKLQDVFVCDQTDSSVTSTKSVTVEQIGNAICGEQVHADLETDDQTIIGGINENKDKVGDLSTLTTTEKSSIVGAVNSINEVIDISSAFVPNSGISNYDFFVRAYYNKGMKKVSGSFSCRVTSGTLGTLPMCTIDSDYRPSSNTGFPIIATLSGGVTFYSCTIGSNGQITQNLTSSLTGVFCYFEYYI